MPRPAIGRGAPQRRRRRCRRRKVWTRVRPGEPSIRSMRVLAESAYPISTPSSRVRVAAFAPFLAAHGVDLNYRPTLTVSEYGVLGSEAAPWRKAATVARSLRRSSEDLDGAYDLRLVHRLHSL